MSLPLIIIAAAVALFAGVARLFERPRIRVVLIALSYVLALAALVLWYLGY